MVSTSQNPARTSSTPRSISVCRDHTKVGQLTRSSLARTLTYLLHRRKLESQVPKHRDDPTLDLVPLSPLDIQHHVDQAVDNARRVDQAASKDAHAPREPARELGGCCSDAGRGWMGE